MKLDTSRIDFDRNDAIQSAAAELRAQRNGLNDQIADAVAESAHYSREISRLRDVRGSADEITPIEAHKARADARLRTLNARLSALGPKLTQTDRLAAACERHVKAEMKGAMQ